MGSPMPSESERRWHTERVKVDPENAAWNCWGCGHEQADTEDMPQFCPKCGGVWVRPIEADPPTEQVGERWTGWLWLCETGHVANASVIASREFDYQNHDGCRICGGKVRKVEVVPASKLTAEREQHDAQLQMAEAEAFAAQEGERRAIERADRYEAALGEAHHRERLEHLRVQQLEAALREVTLAYHGNHHTGNIDACEKWPCTALDQRSEGSE